MNFTFMLWNLSRASECRWNSADCALKFFIQTDTQLAEDFFATNLLLFNWLSWRFKVSCIFHQAHKIFSKIRSREFWGIRGLLLLWVALLNWKLYWEVEHRPTSFHISYQSTTETRGIWELQYSPHPLNSK